MGLKRMYVIQELFHSWFKYHVNQNKSSKDDLDGKLAEFLAQTHIQKIDISKPWEKTKHGFISHLFLTFDIMGY